MTLSKYAEPARRSLPSACATAIESLEGRTLFSTFTVTTAADSGGGSLRQAILDANAHGGADTITFAIGTGAKSISPTNSLPGLGDGTTLDATTQPGFAGKPLITLNGSSAGASADGLKITGSGVTVRGLVINRFGGSGMLVLGAGGNRIAGNYIGTDSSGAASAGNTAHGILLQSPNNIVGGTNSADRNVVSANGGSGVFVYTAAATGNQIFGNYIGTNAAGSGKLGNGHNGVQMESAAGNFVGGSASGARNVISGNARDGVLIINAGSALNVVQGNFIGTDSTGSQRLGNSWYGVEISRTDNVVGGAKAGARNVISANGYGGVVLNLATASGNRVQGNYIGTDLTGTQDLGNTGRGVEFTNGAHDNRVGGTTPGEGNVISGNDNGGVGFYRDSSMNLLQGNLIGTDAAGEAPLGNANAGVAVTDHAGTNFIGGRNAGNVISANNQGIALTSGTSPTIVQGNKIGTNAGGTKKLGNTTDGIYVGSSQNQIGGKKKGTGNVISGNGGDAIRLNNSAGNLIRRNIIGLSAGGTKALGNGKNGVLMINTNTTAVGGNAIAYNGGHGVQVATGSGNTVVSNSIYGNEGLGINLGWDNATKNDASDADTGANMLQNYPTIASIKPSADATTIAGTIASKPNASIYIELFTDAGRTFVGATTVKTNGSGAAAFSFLVSGISAGSQVLATATGPDGNTSEYSVGMSA